MDTVLKVLGLLIYFVLRIGFVTVYVSILTNLTNVITVIDFYGGNHPLTITLTVGILALALLLDDVVIKFYRFLNKRV